jgi:hypothetical protein
MLNLPGIFSEKGSPDVQYINLDDFGYLDPDAGPLPKNPTLPPVKSLPDRV